MDFKQLEAYVKVIECESFSKAAEAIFLSQPSVSNYVNTLEKELDTTLLNRSTKAISPTLAGKIFYENAKELISLKYNAIERIRNLSGDLKGNINISASTVPSQYLLPKLLAGFNAVYPDISFDVRQADTFGVSRAIAGQKAEIGFSGGVSEDERCEFREFMTERMIFIAPYDEAFPAAGEYSTEELLYKHRFITREKGSGTRAQYEAFFARQHINLNQMNVCACFDNTQSVINAVVNGLGIAVVSEFAARAFIQKKMVLPIKLRAELPERKFYYVLKKNFARSHLVDLFIAFLMRAENLIDNEAKACYHENQ